MANLHVARDELYGVIDRMGYELTLDTYRARKKRARKGA